MTLPKRLSGITWLSVIASLLAGPAVAQIADDETYILAAGRRLPYLYAISLADAVFKSIKTEEAKLDRSILVKKLFGQVLGREPSKSELESTLEFLQQMEAAHAQLKFKPREFPKVVERTANEENTGQPFQFRETLFEYQDYVPDLQASDVDETTRALADVALALLNSNEFVTIE